eukprot:Rmarinus@m.21519
MKMEAFEWNDLADELLRGFGDELFCRVRNVCCHPGSTDETYRALEDARAFAERKFRSEFRGSLNAAFAAAVAEANQTRSPSSRTFECEDITDLKQQLVSVGQMLREKSCDLHSAEIKIHDLSTENVKLNEELLSLSDLREKHVRLQVEFEVLSSERDHLESKFLALEHASRFGGKSDCPEGGAKTKTHKEPSNQGGTQVALTPESGVHLPNQGGTTFVSNSVGGAINQGGTTGSSPSRDETKRCNMGGAEDSSLPMDEMNRCDNGGTKKICPSSMVQSNPDILFSPDLNSDNSARALLHRAIRAECLAEDFRKETDVLRSQVRELLQWKETTTIRLQHQQKQQQHYRPPLSPSIPLPLPSTVLSPQRVSRETQTVSYVGLQANDTEDPAPEDNEGWTQEASKGTRDCLNSFIWDYRGIEETVVLDKDRERDAFKDLSAAIETLARQKKRCDAYWQQKSRGERSRNLDKEIGTGSESVKALGKSIIESEDVGRRVGTWQYDEHPRQELSEAAVGGKDRGTARRKQCVQNCVPERGDEGSGTETGNRFMKRLATGKEDPWRNSEESGGRVRARRECAYVDGHGGGQQVGAAWEHDLSTRATDRQDLGNGEGRICARCMCISEGGGGQREGAQWEQGVPSDVQDLGSGACVCCMCVSAGDRPAITKENRGLSVPG